MGEPVELSDAERSRIRKLARAVVQSVVDDAKMPHGLEPLAWALVAHGVGECYERADVESLITQLSQEICNLVDEKQAFCRAFQVVDVPTKESE